MFYKELLEAYPEAKVILTERDNPELWQASFVETIQPYLDWRHGEVSSIYGRLLHWYLSRSPVWQMNEILRKHFMYPDIRNTGAIFYQGYNDEIKRLVPADRLLVMNLKEGWGPLCDFLGKDVPNEPFPRINERAVIQKNIGWLREMSTTEFHKELCKIGVVVVSGLGIVTATAWAVWF